MRMLADFEDCKEFQFVCHCQVLKNGIKDQIVRFKLKEALSIKRQIIQIVRSYSMHMHRFKSDVGLENSGLKDKNLGQEQMHWLSLKYVFKEGSTKYHMGQGLIY